MINNNNNNNGNSDGKMKVKVRVSDTFVLSLQHRNEMFGQYLHSL